MAFSLAASTSFTPVLRCKPCELSCIQPAIQCANLGASNALSSGKKKLHVPSDFSENMWN